MYPDFIKLGVGYGFLFLPLSAPNYPLSDKMPKCRRMLKNIQRKPDYDKINAKQARYTANKTRVRYGRHTK